MPPCGGASWGPPRLKTRTSPGLWQCVSPHPRTMDQQQQQLAERHGKDRGIIVSLTTAPKSDFLIEDMARPPPQEYCGSAAISSRAQAASTGHQGLTATGLGNPPCDVYPGIVRYMRMYVYVSASHIWPAGRPCRGGATPPPHGILPDHLCAGSVSLWATGSAPYNSTQSVGLLSAADSRCSRV